MAWFSGKVNLGNFADLAGAVNKLSESVKNIEKNFDSALGLEEKPDAAAGASEASGLWPSATDRKALFEPIMGFMGQKDDEEVIETIDKQKAASPVKEEQIENDRFANIASESRTTEESNEELKTPDVEKGYVEETQDISGEPRDGVAIDHNESEMVSPLVSVEVSELAESAAGLPEGKISEEAMPALSEPEQPESTGSKVPATKMDGTGLPLGTDNHEEENKEVSEVLPAQAEDEYSNVHDESKEPSTPDYHYGDAEETSGGNVHRLQSDSVEALEAVSKLFKHEDDAIVHPIDQKQHTDNSNNLKEQDMSPMKIDQKQDTHDNDDVKEKHMSTVKVTSDITDSVAELEKVKKEMKMMETALQGAARQAQAKADEISKLMIENEQLTAVIDDLRRKSNDAEIESLREEYHQRVAALERKVYALTKERDTLRREQSKKSDAAALLKEKDEIISQVMAEGEELSKKQAAQESQMRKLRAQIRELEEEKKGLLTKLQVEENKVESIKRDKASTEKLLQETVEKHQAELAAQKEYFTSALNSAKEAEALAQVRGTAEAKIELDSRLREAEERESMLIQTLEELRQTLSRKEQQAVFKEDMLRRDIEDLQKRYQESERRCEELISQVPDSTRPLLRQIEAMQETAARRAEAWTAVERSLNSRLQEAEAKAAAAEEKERSMNERLTQTLSRINVLEAQISCLRAEQTQLMKSLEKERQRAAEQRQEYLARKEEADTQEGRVHQLENEIRELKRKQKEELQEVWMHRELLQQELQRERLAQLEQEKSALLPSPVAPDHSPLMRQKSASYENGSTRKLSTASSVSSMEESYFLQTTLDSSDNISEHKSMGEGAVNPYYLRSVTSNTFEAALRQKEGELASYMSRLASMESIRDSLAEELVKMTAECEKLRAEAAVLPGVQAELEALRRRHSAALELMGERDEELEELRADIVDLKEMYREQVNLLVNKIQVLGSSSTSIAS